MIDQTDDMALADRAPDGPHAQKIAYGFSEKLVLLSESGSVGAESIATLMSHLHSRHVQDYRRALAFCGATKGVGCSFLSANVAVAMAMAGVRTVLVDANLRDPEIDEYIRPSVEKGGLLQCLTGAFQPVDEVLHTEVIPNLSVLYAGGRSRESGHLASARFADLLTGLMRDHDLTIVDTPPASQSADALRVANLLRYALVVVRKNRSYVNDVRKLVADLRMNRVEVLGTYLNGR